MRSAMPRPPDAPWNTRLTSPSPTARCWCSCNTPPGPAHGHHQGAVGQWWWRLSPWPAADTSGPGPGFGMEGRSPVIVVTGATGHVGGELVRALADAGRQVRALTYRGGEGSFPAGVQAVGGDLNDPPSLRPGRGNAG
jgi:NmrA-like family protein